MSAKVLAVFHLAISLIADTSFVLASRPPHHADATEIRKDKQAFVDLTISRIPLLVGPLIYGLSFAQLWYSWDGGADMGGTGGLLELVGVATMIAGAQLRLWCYRELGRFFTFNLAIRKVSAEIDAYAYGILPDHKLVTTGPYALVRHPSYSGIAMMSFGLALRYTSSSSFLHRLFPNWVLFVALCSSTIAPTYLLGKRIEQEEAMLAKEFGDDWKRYRARSWKLVPYLW